MDEYIRESLAIEMTRSIKSQDVIATSERLVGARGAPQYLRSDHGSESVAEAVQQWPWDGGVSTLYTAPGSLWEDAYIESFNSRPADEPLSVKSSGEPSGSAGAGGSASLTVQSPAAA